MRIVQQMATVWSYTASSIETARIRNQVRKLSGLTLQTYLYSQFLFWLLELLPWLVAEGIRVHCRTTGLCRSEHRAKQSIARGMSFEQLLLRQKAIQRMPPKFVYSIHTVAEPQKRHLMMHENSQLVET
jgi:hypothetical protein